MTVEEVRAKGKFVETVKGPRPGSLYSYYEYQDKFYVIHNSDDELVAEIDRDGSVKLFNPRDRALLKKVMERGTS